MLKTLITLIGAAALIAGCCQTCPAPAPAGDQPEQKKAAPTSPAAAAPAPAKQVHSPREEKDDKVISLFDGKTLKNWKPSDFGGDAETRVENGSIVVGAGATLSGVTWKGQPLPTMNYEIELDAMKVSGDDFFLGLTFPYGKNHASLILGGWGGSMVGISSIDDFDAANNDTATSRDFKRNTWYHVKVKVTKDKIEAWVDDDQIINADLKDRKVDVRVDIDAAKPLGLSTYQTVGAYKNIVVRKL